MSFEFLAVPKCKFSIKKSIFQAAVACSQNKFLISLLGF